MNIMMMHLQHAATQEGYAAQVPADKAQSTAFVQTLNQLLAVDGQEQSAEALPGMFLPLALLLPNMPQLAEETPLYADVSALVAALQAAEPSELAALQQQPSVRSWVQQVEELAARFIGQANDGQPQLQGNQALPVAQSASDPLPQSVDSLLAALSKFQSLLDLNAQQAPVQALSSQLQSLLLEIAAVAPLANVAVKQEHVGAQPALGTSNKPIGEFAFVAAMHEHEGAKPQLAGQTLQQDAGHNGTHMLLHRLAYMKPNVHVISAQQGSGEAPTQATPSVELSAHASNVQPVESLANSGATVQIVKAPEQPLPLHVEAKPATGYTMNAHRFADEMSGLLIKNMKISQLAGVSEAKITLMPEHLGQLNLKIAVHNGQLTAHFAAESLYARELLEAQLPQLRAALQLQGLQVDKLEVTQNVAQAGFFQEQQQSSRQFAQHNGQTHGGQPQGEGNFAAEIEQVEQANRMMYGSTFIATA